MFARALPSIFTVGNLTLGIMAIILAVEKQWEYGAILVIIGMFLDGLDGRVARMLNTQSEFGKELDSLSDVISFGVAPALIMYKSILYQLGPIGWIITAAFPVCGALRLARFNVKPGIPGYFIGLPITAAGGVLATMALYSDMVNGPAFMVFGMLFLSFLMISQIKYPNFKKLGIPRSAYWIAPLIIILMGGLAARFPSEFPKIVFIPLALYAFYGVKRSISRRRHRDRDEPIEELKP
ncbi:CDP-diacylglycerol--serine O-phosphatidyltransferase [Kroppenstedtia guangzhouensis]|uniref:CDP-diacylglycerol--serine O-phosphatidyltransferase n=1 Tax=Kroppenstedtia guangzhouensis TaxID=1274356 RepID=A0ABQ1H4T5_9BACL|nr:CDP-diacylglycerol--serine O-phosphatidyltransferase [Kroppenstedtia guangzhouensis]GGA57628.1 CDP-diacylglycerol--serine O-phosphatidyltransferase [Kroppenstedtia guangzhouensis]